MADPDDGRLTALQYSTRASFPSDSQFSRDLCSGLTVENDGSLEEEFFRCRFRPTAVENCTSEAHIKAVSRTAE